MSVNDDSGIEYCLAQIRRYDRDRTLTVLAAATSVRQKTLQE